MRERKRERGVTFKIKTGKAYPVIIMLFLLLLFYANAEWSSLDYRAVLGQVCIFILLYFSARYMNVVYITKNWIFIRRLVPIKISAIKKIIKTHNSFLLSINKFPIKIILPMVDGNDEMVGIVQEKAFGKKDPKDLENYDDNLPLPRVKVTVFFLCIEIILYYILLAIFVLRSAFVISNASLFAYSTAILMLLLTFINIFRVARTEAYYFGPIKTTRMFLRSVIIYFLPLTDIYRIFLLMRFKDKLSYKAINKKLARFTVITLILSASYSFLLHQPINYNLSRKYKIQHNFYLERGVFSAQMLMQGSFRMLTHLAIEARGVSKVSSYIKNMNCDKFFSDEFRADFLKNLIANRNKTSSTKLTLDLAYLSAKIYSCGNTQGKLKKEHHKITQTIQLLDYSLMLQENYFNHSPYNYLTFPYVYPLNPMELILLIAINEGVEVNLISLLDNKLNALFQTTKKLVYSNKKYSKYKKSFSAIEERINIVNENLLAHHKWLKVESKKEQKGLLGKIFSRGLFQKRSP